jgi:hypothetical protein
MRGVGLLTGHCPLKGHIFKLGLSNSLICKRCLANDKPATYTYYVIVTVILSNISSLVTLLYGTK